MIYLFKIIDFFNILRGESEVNDIIAMCEDKLCVPEEDKMQE